MQDKTPEITDNQVIVITTAYVQGMGKGLTAGWSNSEIANPYSSEWGCDAAWRIGYNEGKKRARQDPLEEPQAVAVPEGWKLVPVDPTEQMEQAAADYLGACVKACGLWKAMIASAPECAALAATPAAEMAAPVLVDDMKQELMALYNKIMKQGRGMHYWNYAAAVLDRYRNALGAAPAAVPSLTSPPLTPDEARQAARTARLMNGPSDVTQPHEYVMAGALALAAKIGEASAASAPVVLPEPDAAIKEVMGLIADLEREAADVGYGHGSQRLVNEKRAAIESKLRALLATATGLPAYAVPAFCHVASLKLKNLQERGYQITGYAIEKPVDGAMPGRGFINHGGFVGWWRDGQTPQAQADARDAAQEKPPAGRYVLAWMEGKEIPIRAMWVPKSWLVAGDECPEGWAEYDEDKDEYYCPEGWYEANEHEETHWHVRTPIAAWVELPRRATIAAQAAQGGE
ncbi:MULTISPECIES: hypothetical protein [unclassified Comamonas]|uniref:hypothetical protein n=1 Tax=unclassified Comamonas TaxID=2638500 RepID=UPI001FA7C29A|nr:MULTISPECIES: hypothetical protein [unclassified Comamonas]UNV89415.1 hypothetical protein MP576_17625 [Comamonas sp. 7D-2evo1]UNV97287.1 hypothetical protein MPZ60_08780 [Comamonas sp. 7D-2]UNV99059.1 hypothetical protein MP579_17630 [Comamonas sp. 7D-2evo2]